MGTETGVAPEFGDLVEAGIDSGSDALAQRVAGSKQEDVAARFQVANQGADALDRVGGNERLLGKDVLKLLVIFVGESEVVGLFDCKTTLFRFANAAAAGAFHAIEQLFFGAGQIGAIRSVVFRFKSRGLAVFDPRTRQQPHLAPVLHLVVMTANGDPVDLARPAQLPPESQRVQFRYAALHLSAPEQVQYSYKFEGVDPDWVRAGSRRLINYNSLHHGHYRFLVRATLPGGPFSERDYAFDVLPHFYETAWFRILAVVLAVGAASRPADTISCACPRSRV